MVFSCFAVYLRIIMHGLYHILLVVYTTQNMVQPVHDYPRRYTAKQLKTIYYSLNLIHCILSSPPPLEGFL